MKALKRMLSLLLALFAFLPAAALPARAAGQPAITFTKIPVKGSSDQFISGRVILPGGAANYGDYFITAYIQVPNVGGWWGPKPTTASPRNAISSSGDGSFGSFNLQFASYGQPADLEAIQIMVFLVPASASNASIDFTYLTGQSTARAAVARADGGVITVDGAKWVAPEDYSAFDAKFPGVRKDARSAPKRSVNYSPYVLGQRPGRDVPSEAQIRRDLTRIANSGFDSVRFFTVEKDLACMYDIAAELGLKTIGTAWLDRSMSQSQVNEQLNRLIALCNAGKVSIASCGSEAIFRGDFTAQQISGFIRTVKAGLTRPVPVTTMCVSGTFINSSDDPAITALCDDCDIILCSHYSLFSANNRQMFMATYPGGVMQYAQDETINAYNEIKSKVGPNKPVVLAELGYATKGSANGLAVPNEANARNHFDRMDAWARNTSGVDIFWFSSHDELYKEGLNEGGMGIVGGNFGLFDGYGNTKACYKDLFPSLCQAAGHRFGALAILLEPTPTATGERRHTCLDCGHTETETLPKLKPAALAPGKTPYVLNPRQRDKLTVTGAAGPVTYTTAGTEIIDLQPDGSVLAKRPGIAVVTACAADQSVTIEVRVEYSLGQWLLVVFLFGWIWL